MSERLFVLTPLFTEDFSMENYWDLGCQLMMAGGNGFVDGEKP